MPQIPRLPASVEITQGCSLALSLFAAAIAAFALVGEAATYHYDAAAAAGRHEALQQALDEFDAVFGAIEHFDAAQVAMIERRSGLTALRFDREPRIDGDRELQSVQNGQGRIVGWLSWQPARGIFRAMYWLWGLAGAIGIAIMPFAAVLTRTTHRLIAVLRQSIETARRLITQDFLTGLPNQRTFLEILERELGRRRYGRVVLARINIDNFREVNDTVGRQGGDAVLCAIGQRLRSVLPRDLPLARFKEDEFAYIVAGAACDTADTLLAAVRAALAEPIAVADGQMLAVSAGIGVAQAPEDATGHEELTRRAGLALRVAKREGRNVLCRFSPEIELEQADRRFLLRELKTALALAAFDVNYQPIVAANGFGIVGVEALLRWTHASRGAIPPSTFIPLAEQNGLMGELGEFVLRRALNDARRWPGLYVAINLSPVQIRAPGIVALVESVVAAAGINPSRVVLEMTESVLIDDPEQTLARLQALRALGVGLALDDFGTGYSSLGYLQKFPFQRIKIDRAFVGSLGTRGNAGAIIQSIVTLGHGLGMSILAEGIETDEQRVLLRLAGCDEMQGFLFGRPGAAEAIDTLVAPSAPVQDPGGHAAVALP